MDASECFLYAAGLFLTFAFDDLSFKAVASQSQIFIDPSNLYAASNAVDRDTATCMRTVAIGNNAPDKTTWWKVDLGGTFNIYSINILFKNYDNYENRQRGRLAGFSLHVSNAGNIQGATLCYKDGPQLPPLNFTTECIESGRYVIFYNERLDGVTYPTEYQLTNVIIELCEVIVKGCKQLGVYGSKCDIPCPVKCRGNRCHIISGACLDCENGVYGGYCNLSCPKNCKDNICNIQSGQCLECEHGVYGNYCNISCPTNCKDNTCHIQSGTCFTCKPGWIGIYCNTKCREDWYGESCGLQCSGHCIDGVTCNHMTGQCDRGCDAGWTGTTCEKECKDGTYGYNCISNCSGHCLYNSPCNKQTGLCDRGCNPGYTNGDCIIECLPGYFGIDCSGKCSRHCINNEPCDHVSGVCPNGCQDGFVGTFCNKSCNEGYFGTNCSRVCSPNCQRGQCRHTNGSCTSCVEGWMGYNCTTEIPTLQTNYYAACFQSYGENCRYPCSLHCYNNTCNKHNGRCLIGCKDGFYGERCAKENVLKIQSISSSIMLTIGLSVSILINIIFIVCGVLLWRRNKSSKVTLSGNLLSCWKKSLYQDIVVKNDETSTYQELDLSESTYQNTAIP